MNALLTRTKTFFADHYHGGSMKLCVIGGDSLTDLERWVRKYFDGVKDGPKSMHAINPPKPIWDASKLHVIESVEGLTALQLVWMLPPYSENNHLEMPEVYLIEVLSNQSKESLYGFFKEKDWVADIEVSLEGHLGDYRSGGRLFSFSLYLTNSGLKKKYEMINYVYQYIKLLRDMIPQEWVWNQYWKMKEIEFDCIDVSGMAANSPSDFARYLSECKTLEKLRSQDMAMKRNGKSPASSESDESVMFFRDVSLGPHETRLRFRLIHFWEAQNPVKKTLIGLEMLLIDEQGTVIQGFIPPGRIKKYLPEMKRGSVYELINFYGSKNKPMYRVADHIATVSFAWNSELSVLHDIPIPFDEDRFRMHSYEDFEANCDLKGDLYDVLGHMKLVDGQALTERPTIDEAKLATTRHIMVHVQSHEGPVMKLYLWDQAATDFCKKFKSYENTPTVLLVTAVNTKRLGGNLALSSMSPTRVFMDYDVQPTIDYFAWLSSNPEIAKQVSAEVVTKRETMTISDIFSYMTLESAKDAFFECTATIDDVVHGSAWYYIACTGCHSKATKGANSLICTNPRCVKDTTAGVAQYRAKISVYDSSEQGFFVLLGDAGFQLTGRHASELVSSYFEANKDKGPDHEVPVPEALISIVGQTHKFCVKVTDHNFSGNTRAITVTKILPPETSSPTKGSVDNAIAATSMEAVQTGSEVCGPSKSRGDSADEESKRTFDSVDPEKVKRARCEK